MLEEASNRDLLALWQTGNERAATILVRRYMTRLTALARSRLTRKLTRRVDPDDVVLSAWRSFFLGAKAGRFLADEDDNLWPLLVTITLRKLAKQGDLHFAQRRSVASEVDFGESKIWPEIVSRDPTPEQGAILADEVESLMSRLTTQQSAVLQRLLQGDDQKSISRDLGCSERTVRRTISEIRIQLADREPVAADAIVIIERDDAAEAHRKLVTAMKRSPASQFPLDWNPTLHDADHLLLRLVGQGGFGKVYCAERKTDGQRVAIKFLRKSLWNNSRAREAFLRETKIVSQIDHLGIIRHHGGGAAPRGAIFLAMDWIDGPILDQWSHTAQPDLASIWRVVFPVLDALIAAHRAGVIHGDLAPANVLLRSHDSPVVTDFGFARCLGVAPSPGGGTPGYLAPEQLDDSFGPVSPRTDVYGWGALVYALIAGSPPMTGEDLPAILAHVLSSRGPATLSISRPDLPASR